MKERRPMKRYHDTTRVLISNLIYPGLFFSFEEALRYQHPRLQLSKPRGPYLSYGIYATVLETLLFNFTLACQNRVHILLLPSGSMFDNFSLSGTSGDASPFDRVTSTVPTVLEFLIRYLQRFLLFVSSLSSTCFLNTARIFQMRGFCFFFLVFFNPLLFVFVYFLRACTSSFAHLFGTGRFF